MTDDRPVHHPVFARVYRAIARVAEGRGLAEHRAALLSGLSGTVLEVGAGDGANLRHYPSSVTRVVAVEPEASLRARALEAARSAPVPVTVVDAVADALPLTDGEADAVVLCLVLCSVPDPDQAAREVARVLRPGGEVRVLEHVAAAPGTRLRAVQERVDRWFWPRLFGGCHTARDPLGALTAAGLSLAEEEHHRFPPGSALPVSPHVRARLTS
ncbi:MAG: class I SAM-dependent methyltransferase [Nocardioides sp.]|nr:class I SAM-dependent methyltransferase [Nocardioides sp.]